MGKDKKNCDFSASDLQKIILLRHILIGFKHDFEDNFDKEHPFVCELNGMEDLLDYWAFDYCDKSVNPITSVRFFVEWKTYF